MLLLLSGCLCKGLLGEERLEDIYDGTVRGGRDSLGGGGREKHCNVRNTMLHTYNIEYDLTTSYLYMGGQLGTIHSHYSVLKPKLYQNESEYLVGQQI